METKKSRLRTKKKTVRKQGLFEADVLRAVTTEFIRNRERFYSPQIARTIVSDLRAQLIQGIDAGDRVSDLQARVRKVLVTDAPNRISKIIRTEINAGMNAGALESYKSTKQVSRKKWLTAGDILVRGNRPGDQFSHKDAHGQVVKVEDPFIVGGQRLQHPGDPAGSAANIIRCRCTTVPILLGQRLARPKPVVVPAAPRPDTPPKPRPEKEGRPFPVARPGQAPLPGFTETLPSGPTAAEPSVPQSIAPGTPTRTSRLDASQTRIVNAPVLSSKPLKGGANDSELHTLKDGSQVVFKPKKGERSLREAVKAGTYYKREAATYDVARVMGVDDLVPATVVKVDNLTDNIGSAQDFVKGTEAGKIASVDKKYDGRKDLQRAATFDYAIGNTDRHAGNWMIRAAGPKKGSFALIDNGLAFPTDNNVSEAFFSKKIINRAIDQGIEIPQDLVKQWRDNFAEIERALAENGIEKKAIKAMKDRLDILAEMGDFPELAGFDKALQRGRLGF